MFSDDCYTLEVLTFEDPLFTTIPTAYLITMTGSSRRNRYLHQLRRYRPTGRVVVVHNRGFRACKKPAWVTTSAMDLWHANATILAKHVQESDAPVLVLEDDVEFTEDLVSKCREIEAFVAQEHVDVYSLGSAAWLSYPVDWNHLRVLYASLTQAVIFTNKGARRFQEVEPGLGFHDFDMYSQLSSYMGTTPTATQRFEHTANAELWTGPGDFLIRYNNAFGGSFFHVHALMSAMGGIIPFYVSLLLITRNAIRALVRGS